MKTVVALMVGLQMVGFGVLAAPSGPKKTKADPAVVDYNAGVELVRAKDFAAAQGKFEAALAAREDFAEAHNNLAYALRKQGKANHAAALGHYNRALELDPKLAEATMYRGVLFVSMGDVASARVDLVRLETLNPDLAKELAFVIETGAEKAPEQFFGVTGKVKR